MIYFNKFSLIFFIILILSFFSISPFFPQGTNGKIKRNVPFYLSDKQADYVQKDLNEKSSEEIQSNPSKDINKKSSEEIQSNSNKDLNKKSSEEIQSNSSKDINEKSSREIKSNSNTSAPRTNKKLSIKVNNFYKKTLLPLPPWGAFLINFFTPFGIGSYLQKDFAAGLAQSIVDVAAIGFFLSANFAFGHNCDISHRNFFIEIFTGFQKRPVQYSLYLAFVLAAFSSWLAGIIVPWIFPQRKKNKIRAILRRKRRQKGRTLPVSSGLLQTNIQSAEKSPHTKAIIKATKYKNEKKMMIILSLWTIIH